MSSENQTPHQVSRRAVVGAAVWAVPVIAISTATPAFAAGSGTITGLAVYNSTNPPKAKAKWTKDAVVLNHAQIQYQPSGFNGVAYGDTPLTAIVTWGVVLKDASGAIVGTFVPQETVSLARSGNASYSNKEVTGLTPGATYTVVSEITSVQFPDNPLKGTTFYTPPSSAEKVITLV